MFGTIERHTDPDSGGTGDFLTKEDLKDRLIVFKVVEFDPQHEGEYGVTEKVVIDLLIVDGDRAGHVEDGFWAYGNLAKQIGRTVKVGASSVARVVSGSSKGRNPWYGVEFAISDDEYQQAMTAIANVQDGDGGTAAADKPRDIPF